MSSKYSITSDINMALTTQILVFCSIVALSSAHVILNRHHHRPQNGLGDLPQLLTNMFNPINPMQGLLQIQPINHPGILGFQSFGGQGLGDFSGGMFGQGQGGFGTEDTMPLTSYDRDDGNSQGPVYDFGEEGRNPFIGTETPQDSFGDQFDNHNKEMDENKPDDTDNSNKDKEFGKSNSMEKEADDQKGVDSSGTDKTSDPNKNQPEDNLVSKNRDKDAIIFPDKIDQAKDQIAKESSYYVTPQQPNGYVSSPGPQIVYAVSIAPSGSSSNQGPYVPNTIPSNSPSQPTLSSVQSYPSTNNVNTLNPQPQIQTNGNAPMGNVVSTNSPASTSYTLVTIPNNGATTNTPTYVTNNAPVSNPPQNINNQPLSTGQQYYLVSMNGQNVLVPVNNVQTVPNQSNGNNQYNLIPINQGSYVPSNSPVNYVPANNQNVSPTTSQNNGEVHYIAVQLAPQQTTQPQNNNQATYVPTNSGTVQPTVQNTAQGNGNYVPVSNQPTIQMPPQNNNQVTYVSGNPPQVVQMAPQNQPQNNNQVTYMSGNPPQVVQMAPQNQPQNNNQVTYVTGNPPQVVQLVPQNQPQNNNQVTYVSGNPQQVVQMVPQSNNPVNYVSANPQTLVQVGSNVPTNSGQVTYVPLSSQNPQSTTQYNLVPFNPQNNGQSNLMTLVPATLTTNGNVSLLSFKEKNKSSSKDTKKQNKKIY